MPSGANDNLRGFAWMLHLAGGLVAVLLVGIFWCAVEQPMSRHQDELTHEIAQSLGLIQSASSVRERHKTLQAELDDLNNVIQQLDARTATVHPAGLFERFAELSKRVGATVHDYRPGQIQRSGELDEHRLQFVMSGDYTAVCRFLIGLEELPLLCHLAQLKIVNTGAAGAPVNMELSLRCYTTPRVANPVRTASK